MKVLVISIIFPSERNKDSGTYVKEQVVSLASQSVQVAVVSKKGRSCIYFLPFGMKAIYKTIWGNFDVIHAHYGFHSAIFPLLCGKKPLVVTFHGSDALFEPRRNAFYGFLQRKVVSNASHIIAVSNQIKGHLTHEFGIDTNKVSVIPCGVDTEKFRPLSKERCRQELGIPRDLKVVLFVGRLTHEKGLDVLKESTRILRHIHFYFIGDGPLRWDAANCHFMGVEAHECMPMWMNAADILVLPSRSEGTPAAVIEAFACATPVVCTSVGDCEMIVQDGHTGLLIEPDDSKSLTSAIQKAIEETRFDKSACRHKAVSDYDINRISERLLKTYSLALERRL